MVNTDVLSFLVNRVADLDKATIIIGIDGGQGSGKSTFIQELYNHFCSDLNYKAIFLETDDFLIERNQRENLPSTFFQKQENLERLFDFERMTKIIKIFQTKKNVHIILDKLYNTQSGKRDRRGEYVFGSKNILLIGGPYLLEKAYPKFDMKVFLYATKERRLKNTFIRTLNKQRSIESQKELFNKFELFYNPYFIDRLSEYNILIDNNDFDNRVIITQDAIVD